MNRDCASTPLLCAADTAASSVRTSAVSRSGSAQPTDRWIAAELAGTRLRRLLPISLLALLSGLLTLWGLTRSGFANTYYAEAAQAAAHSWSAWLTNATDASLSVSLDKGPLPNMVLGLSGRLLGFSSFSLLLPEALCGVGAVLLLYDAVRRTLGRRAGLLAATMLALTPVFVAMSRFDNPDALLVLLEVAAAWALLRALQSGRTRWVLVSAVLVGLAFNVKMLQAYLIVPGLAAALLLAGQGTVRRRFAQLAAGGAAMLAVSFAWYGTMMLIPAGSRPWVGDTTDNSWFSLIFGANGIGRVAGERAGAGPAGAGGFGGAAGLLRLFNPIVGGQIAWLLPLAAIGLGLGLCSARRAPRTDPRRAAYVLWGGWAAVSWLVFSFAEGIFHPYYTTALAPAIAALAAGGLILMWDRARGSTAWALALGASVLGTAVLATGLLDRTPRFVPAMGPLAIALAVVAAGALLLRRAAPAAAALGLAALLAGPTAYALATVAKPLSGGNPLAGPAAAERLGGSGALGGHAGGPLGAGGRPAAGGFAPAPGAVPGGPPTVAPSGGARGAGGQTAGGAAGAPAPGLFAPGIGAAARSGSLGRGAPLFGAGVGAGAGAPGASSALVRYLKAHQGDARYIVAAVGSGAAGSIAVQSGREAIDMGGFMGSDPAPTLTKLRALIDAGQLRYVLTSGTATDIASVGLAGAPPGAAQASGAQAAILTREAWVRAHGHAVHVTGLGSNAMTLYYF